MKVLFLSLYDPFKSSGPSNHLRCLSNALLNLGCEVHILTPGTRTKITRINGLIIHYAKTGPFGKGFLFSLTTIGLVNRIVKEYRIDIVHGQSPSSFGYALLSTSKTPFIVTVHGTSFGEIVSVVNASLSNLTIGVIRNFLIVQPLTALLTKIEYRFADKVVVVSSSMAEETRGFYRLPDSKVVAIYNGINPAVYSKNSELYSDSRTILCVGRLIWRKGIKYLIDALPQIIAQYPTAKLLIVGTGEQKAALQKLIAIYNIADYIQFFDSVSHEELLDLYHRAAIYVQPSLYEPLGIAIMEAMSNGKAVVASNVGGIPELITNGRDGVLVEPGNSQLLSEAIIKLLLNQTLREYYGTNAREKINKEFTWEKIAEKTLKLYQETVS